MVATEAEAAGTDEKTDADLADDGADGSLSGSDSAQGSSRSHSQQSDLTTKQSDPTTSANNTRAAGPEAVKLQLLTLRRKMSEMEWAFASAEKEHTTMKASVKHLESECSLIQRELEAKRLAAKLAEAAEKRQGYENQLEAAITSGADAAAEIEVKTATLSETEVEMRKLAVKMCAVKARTDEMAAHVAEVRVYPTGSITLNVTTRQQLESKRIEMRFQLLLGMWVHTTAGKLAAALFAYDIGRGEAASGDRCDGSSTAGAVGGDRAGKETEARGGSETRTAAEGREGCPDENGCPGGSSKEGRERLFHWNAGPRPTTTKAPVPRHCACDAAPGTC